MVWKPFKAVRSNDVLGASSLGDDRTEIACALMLGARFLKQVDGTWACIDDHEASDDPIHTGWWHHKVNAARAYMSTKGVFFDREGNPIEGGSPVAKVKASGRDIDG